MTQQDHFSTLADAAARNLPVVLSMPSAGMLRHHKSRFLGMTSDALWVESVPSESSLVSELIVSQIPVGIAFKAGPNKVVFSACLRELSADFVLNGQQSGAVEALRLDIPRELKAIQRRSHYRAKVPADEVMVRVWRIGPDADLRPRPPERQELALRVRDLSVGGMGVVAADAAQPPRITEGDRVRVEIKSEDGLLLLAGKVRGIPAQADGSPLKCGIQWVLAQDTAEGRQHTAQLAKLVNLMERQELRRVKLGMAV